MEDKTTEKVQVSLVTLTFGSEVEYNLGTYRQYTTECGTQVNPTDKFCCRCGKQLVFPDEKNGSETPNTDELDLLETKLYRLATEWRSLYPADTLAKQHQRDRIKAKYHVVMKQMFNLGWNGDLDIQAELPHQHMPKIYFEPR